MNLRKRVPEEGIPLDFNNYVWKLTRIKQTEVYPVNYTAGETGINISENVLCPM